MYGEGAVDIDLQHFKHSKHLSRVILKTFRWEINQNIFPGQGTKCDVYRDLSQGRLQREAVVQEGRRRPARDGVHGAEEGRHDGSYSQRHSSTRETDGVWLYLLKLSNFKSHLSYFKHLNSSTFR